MSTSTSLLLLLVTIVVRSNAYTGECDTVYTLGDDEFCTVSLNTLQEDCITFNSSYNVAAGNGLAMDPISGQLYVVLSIGSNKGNRELAVLNTMTYQLTNIATYTSGNEKLSGITFSCSGELYGITGSQSDHSLYSIDMDNGSLTYIQDLDASSKGNGIAFNAMDGYIYRVGGTTQLDIEQIDALTGNITSNYYVTQDDITTVRALGYYRENYLFIIDGNERLFELDTQSGNVTHLHNLTNTRKHKGIVCADFDGICTLFETTIYYNTDTTNTDDSTKTPTGDDANKFTYNIIINLCLFFVANMLY